MNGYLGPPEDLPAPLAADPAIVAQIQGAVCTRELSQLAATSKTFVMFEAGKGVDSAHDHVESPDWFDADNVQARRIGGTEGSEGAKCSLEMCRGSAFGHDLQLPLRRRPCRCDSG